MKVIRNYFYFLFYKDLAQLNKITQNCNTILFDK